MTTEKETILDDEKEVFEMEDSPVEWLEKNFKEIAIKLSMDLEKVIEISERDNTIEPIIHVFQNVLGLVAMICATYEVLDDEDRVKLLNCKGCVHNSECERYLEYKEQKEAEKQGLLFEFPVVYSDKKH